MPKFNDALQNWLEFRDTDESLIHNNESLSNIQRFHYLRACLEDSAAEIIKSLEFSSSNYIIAWKAAEERYNNKKVLIHNHVKNLFNLEPLHHESAENIRDLLDFLSKNLRALQALGEPIDWTRAELLETIEQNCTKPQKQDKRDNKCTTKSFVATGDAQDEPKMHHLLFKSLRTNLFRILK